MKPTLLEMKEGVRNNKRKKLQSVKCIEVISKKIDKMHKGPDQMEIDKKDAKIEQIRNRNRAENRNEEQKID